MAHRCEGAQRPWWAQPAGCMELDRHGRPWRRRRYREAGLTLVECLVSLATVTLAGALVGPPLLLAGATQLQTRRIQQAQHIAQAEVDRVRTLVKRTDGALPDWQDLPPAAAEDLGQQPPPRSLTAVRSTYARCQTGGDLTQPSQAVGIDMDGDAACDPEFILQAFRTGNPDVDTARAAVAPFRLMVRVYSPPLQGFEPLETELVPLTLGTGVGGHRPLAVAATTVIPNTRSDTLLCYHDPACPPAEVEP